MGEERRGKKKKSSQRRIQEATSVFLKYSGLRVGRRSATATATSDQWQDVRLVGHVACILYENPAPPFSSEIKLVFSRCAAPLHPIYRQYNSTSLFLSFSLSRSKPSKRTFCPSSRRAESFATIGCLGELHLPSWDRPLRIYHFKLLTTVKLRGL